VKPWGKGSFFEFHRQWPLTIFDECHRSGSETSLNAKMLIAAVRGGGKVLTLSATAAQTILKLKALGFSLGLHQLSNWRLWLMERGVREDEQILRSGRRFKKLVIDPSRERVELARVHEKIYGPYGCASRLRIADIEDFPATQVEVRILPDLPANVKRLSDEMQEFYRERNQQASIMEDERVKLVFWRQASETAKIPVILDMAEDALETSRVAAFVNFNQTVDELWKAANKRGWTCGVIRGGQSYEQRQLAIERFQSNRLDLIICNLQAGGVGVSLHDPITKVPRTSLICPSWSAVDLNQAIGRPHRNGGGPSRQFILYWGTGIERGVAKSVQRKVANLDTLNEGDIQAGILDGVSEQEGVLV
jgi:hypothetical protein